MSTFPKHKAVVVGSGHNGLTAAIILAQNSWEVEVFEKSYTFWGARLVLFPLLEWGKSSILVPLPILLSSEVQFSKNEARESWIGMGTACFTNRSLAIIV